MAVGDNTNPLNQNILAALGLVGSPNTEPTEPEILEYLRRYGMQDVERKGPDPLLQPVGHEGMAALHWTQGLNSMLRAGLGRGARNTYMDALLRSRRQPPAGQTPPAQPPAVTPPTPPPNITPPAAQPPRAGMIPPFITSVQPSSFTDAPNIRGASEITNAVHQPSGEEDLLHLAQDGQRERPTFHPDSLLGKWFNKPEDNVPRTPQIPPGHVPATTDQFTGEAISDVTSGAAGAAGAAAGRKIADQFSRVQPSGNLPDPGFEDLQPQGTTGNRVDLPEGVRARNIPETTPETPPAAQPPVGERRTINGLPVYTPQDFDAVAEYPPPIPYRFGLSQDGEAFLRNLTPEQRKAQEDHLTYQYTPQFTETLGGRRWIIPATGQTGFIPTPRFDRIRSGNTEATTVTLIDRNGRIRTYVLEPGNSPPPSQPITGAQPPAAQPPAAQPPAAQPPAAQPPAAQPPATTPPSNVTPPSPVTPPAAPPSNVPGPASGTGTTFQDRGIFARQREIDIDQAAKTAAAGALTTTAVAPITEAVNHGRTANQTLQIAGLIESLLNQPGADRMLTGALSGPVLETARSINGVFRAATGGQTLFDESRLSMMEVFHKLNAYLASSASRELTNRPTQFDFQRFIEANPGLSNTIEGNRLLVGILRRFAQRDRDISEYAGRFSQERARTGDMSGYIEGAHQIYDRHMNDFARHLIDTYNRFGGRMTIPRGFRYNNREYLGGDPSKPDSWRAVTATP